MTKLLEKAIAELRLLPDDAQDQAADALFHFAEVAKAPMYRLSAQERSVIDESKAAARRGEFASDAEVEAAYARFAQ